MKCTYIKEDKGPCNANSMTGSEYCFTHNPTTRKQHSLAVKKGGLTPKKLYLENSEPVEINDAGDAKKFLSKVINDVWQGKIPATPVANTFGFLVRCFLDAHEKSEIEDRLDEIEKKINSKV